MKSLFGIARKYIKAKTHRRITHPGGFLSRGRKWLSKMRSEYENIPVSYVHKGKRYDGLSAMVNRTSFQMSRRGEFGSTQFKYKLKEELHDFIFVTDAMPFVTVTEKPVVGDYILMNGVRFNVINTASYHYTGTETQGECFGFTDPSMHSMRVHTILYK